MSVTEIVFFLTTPTVLPVDHGLLAYWQLAVVGAPASSSGFELLASVTPDRPSVVVSTGWSEHEQFVAASTAGSAVQITFGISVEPLSVIQNLNLNAANPIHDSNNPASKRPIVAQKIGQDLFNFLQSFDTQTTDAMGLPPNHMVVPTNIFERWWRRFESKSKRDPNFFMKSSEE